MFEKGMRKSGKFKELVNILEESLGKAKGRRKIRDYLRKHKLANKNNKQILISCYKND